MLTQWKPITRSTFGGVLLRMSLSSEIKREFDILQNCDYHYSWEFFDYFLDKYRNNLLQFPFLLLGSFQKKYHDDYAILRVIKSFTLRVSLISNSIMTCLAFRVIRDVHAQFPSIIFFYSKEHLPTLVRIKYINRICSFSSVSFLFSLLIQCKHCSLLSQI